ncbi:UNVERIFIED_CONTAM: tRNA (guanine(9)-N1)-methyltransferase [Sesamum angustifolium]|uniref:tRNA (guanine(9)-N(1))-methyltransferase n=1 Tax=Sesamum angustifolium TaxID=2727405 RepID=A0AAW2PBR9_9LAMI
MESLQNDDNAPAATQTMSKNAQKRLLKQQRYEAKKAEKKAQMKEHKKREVERKRKEWQEKLASVGEEEREKLIEERKELRKERMEKRTEERGKKIERLQEARINGQNIVIDLEFSHLMNTNELHSLVQQIMYCYAINGRCALPAHLWLTGCQGEMQNQLLRIPGYDKWVIEKEDRSYIDAFQDQKEKLVYLTADSETILDELDPKAVYIIGGLVDRNRWKGITMKKAKEQGIKTAKLPIGAYLKMSSSQVCFLSCSPTGLNWHHFSLSLGTSDLTEGSHICGCPHRESCVEILLKFLETKDWKDSFFQVIPQRKRFEAGSEDNTEEVLSEGFLEEGDGMMPERQEGAEADNGNDKDGQKIGKLEEEDCVCIDDQKAKRQCIEA